MEQMTIEFVFIDRDTPSDQVREMGVDLAEVIVSSKLAGTKSEARRHISSGAIRLNDRVVEDPFARLMMSEDGRFLVVQKPIEPTDPVV